MDFEWATEFDGDDDKRYVLTEFEISMCASPHAPTDQHDHFHVVFGVHENDPSTYVEGQTPQTFHLILSPSSLELLLGGLTELVSMYGGVLGARACWPAHIPDFNTSIADAIRRAKEEKQTGDDDGLGPFKRYVEGLE